MYCSGCGTELLAGGDFCHKCGRKAPQETSPALISQDSPAAASRPRNDEELLLALEKEVPNLHKCYACSSGKGLVYIDFGLGMAETGRKWKEAILSGIVSAVSLPLTGVGKLILPTKKRGIRVIRLRLAVCTECVTAEPDFTEHPWFQILWEYGFNEFIPPNELSLFPK
jgi:hypothetical protein